MNAGLLLELTKVKNSEKFALFKLLAEDALSGKTHCILPLGYDGMNVKQDLNRLKQEIEFFELRGYKVSIDDPTEPKTYKISWEK